MMTSILELENKEDFPTVKKLLEQIRGAKVYEQKYNISAENDLPDYVYEALDKYAESVKEEDCISSKEFFANARKKVCELYSQK